MPEFRSAVAIARAPAEAEARLMAVAQEDASGPGCVRYRRLAVGARPLAPVSGMGRSSPSMAILVTIHLPLEGYVLSASRCWLSEMNLVQTSFSSRPA